MRNSLLFLFIFNCSQIFAKVMMQPEAPLCMEAAGTPLNSDLPSNAKEIADRLTDNWYRPTLGNTLPCPQQWVTYCGELKDTDSYTVLQDHVYDAYYVGDFEEGTFSKVKRDGCVCFTAFCGPDQWSRNTFTAVQSVSQCNKAQRQSFQERKSKAIGRNQGRRY